MGLYQKYILPHLINFVMQDKKNKKERELLVPKATGIVLEIGFGSGLNLTFYTKEVQKLYALELSEELYQLAKKQREKVLFPIEYIHASAEKIPLADHSIDSIVMTWVLCSIPKPIEALHEIRRVLKVEGKLFFVEHGFSSQKHISFWQTFLTPLLKRIAGNCHLDRKIDDLITYAGFDIIELEKGSGKRTLAYQYKGVAIAREEVRD